MRTYEPLSAEHIDWLRRYVERNPETHNGRSWGRFLATLDARAATERDRILLEVSKVRQIVFSRRDTETRSEICAWTRACDKIRDAIRKSSQ